MSTARRQRHNLLRRRRSREGQAQQTQAAQERARLSARSIDSCAAGLRNESLAGLLVGSALTMVLVHILAHSGWRPVPLTMGWQDLLLGYPMAGLLLLTGLVLLGQRRAPR